jgi:O-antigen/teichoic acid export membrane protein
VAAGSGRGITLRSLLAAVPIALGYLGPDRYGVVVTITAMSGLLVFADFGLGNGLMNLVAGADHADRSSAHRSISSAFFMLCGVAVLVAAIAIVAVALVPWTTILNSADVTSANETAVAMGVFFATHVVNLPMAIGQRVQLAYQEGFVNSVGNAVGSVLGLLILFAAVSAEASLPWIVFALMAGPLIGNILNFVWLFFWRHPDLRPQWDLVSGVYARRLLRLGFLFFVLQLTVAVAYQSDILVATRVIGPDAATTYSVTYRLFMIVPTMINMLLLPLWPAYAESIARGDVRWVKRTLRMSIGLAVLLSGASSLVLVVFAPPIIDLWVGPHVNAPFALLLGMALWAVIGNSFNAVAMLLNGASVVGFQVATALSMAVTSVGASVLLANIFGVAGVVWGTVLAYVVCTAIPTAIFLPTALRRLAARSIPTSVGP